MNLSASLLALNALLPSSYNVDLTTKKEIVVMSYNVENLFDTVHTEGKEDFEFTPKGAQKWTERVLADKIKNVNAVILESGADVVGLSEVETDGMVERLLTGGLSAAGFQYKYTATSNDIRGIRTALVSKFPIVSARSHVVSKDSWKDAKTGKKYVTRDVLEATINLGAKGAPILMTVFVNHWPSRRNGATSEGYRMEVAQQVQGFVNETLKKQDQRIVIMGDFNDDIQDASLSQGLDLVRNYADLDKNILGKVYGTSLETVNKPAQERGTFWYDYGKQWNRLDHFFIAGKNGPEYVEGSTEIYRHRFSYNNRPQGCELRDRSKAGSPETCPKGSSDHWPIVAKFQVR